MGPWNRHLSWALPGRRVGCQHYREPFWQKGGGAHKPFYMSFRTTYWFAKWPTHSEVFKALPWVSTNPRIHWAHTPLTLQPGRVLCPRLGTGYWATSAWCCLWQILFFFFFYDRFLKGVPEYSQAELELWWPCSKPHNLDHRSWCELHLGDFVAIFAQSANYLVYHSTL